MFKYACHDLGANCDFTTTGETREEVKKTIWAHAAVVHKDAMEGLTPEQQVEFEKAVDAAIKLV